METKPVRADSLKPFKGNPRRMAPETMEALKRSIKEFGFVEPVVANRDGTVIGGHQRLEAAKVLGMEEVPVHFVDLPEEKAKALNVALNRITGDWDEEKLAELLKELEGTGFDELTGFTNEEIEQLLSGLEEIEPTKEDPLKDIPERVQLGELWQLGNHKLLCGDATKKEDVERLMDGKKSDMVFTDPPYGVSYNEKNMFLNTISPGNRIQKEIVQDNVSEQEICKFWKISFENIRDVLAPINSYYIFGPQIQGMMMMMMMIEAGLPYKHVIIWVKNNHVLGRCDYHYRHEPIFFGWTTKHKFYGNGKFQTSVWEVDKALKNDLHPTMKPIELIENAILNSTLQEQIVLDVFGGSGTTLIACEQLNRKCYMMEIDPRYCDVIIQRWENLTKNKAVKIWPTTQTG